MLLWATIVGLWSLSHRNVRKAAVSFLRALIQWKILLTFGAMLAYTVGVVLALRDVGVWNTSLAKDTITWFLFTAPVLLVGLLDRNASRDGVFGHVFKRVIGIGILVEFLISQYTYPVAVELLLIPVATLAAVAELVANRDPKYRDVGKLLRGVQFVTGFLVVGATVVGIAHDLSGLESWNALRGVVISPLLSACLVPFLYVTLLIMTYENLFLRLGFPPREKIFQQRARRRLILHIRFSLRRALRLLRVSGFELTRVANMAELEQLLHMKSQKPLDQLCD